LGDKIELRISDWILSFSRKTVSDPEDSAWAVRKDGGQFDQFTGATITPRAVVKAVKKAVWYVIQNQDQISVMPFNCGSKK
jgi:electron transport complex protein RnfG